ncbi:MAG TPA: hypothetical protein VMB72_04315 [Acidimicrobiales bacterium]|nr:hypothetical protein [Acidimicrobiales bacterium]
MAIVVQVDYGDMSLDQYDEVVETLGLLPGGPPPPGVLFHCVSARGDGIRILDVWESPEALEDFQRRRIGPVLEQLGVRSPPRMSVVDVHRYYAANPRARR